MTEEKETKYKEITIYTDGSCIGNPGAGGWASLFLINENIELKIISGNEKHTTNNKMELTAAIKALNLCRNGEEFYAQNIILYTDSRYVKDGIESWIATWKIGNKWLTANKTEVLNKELWVQLDQLNTELNIEWRWVKAHYKNEFNKKVDIKAREEAKKIMEKI